MEPISHVCYLLKQINLAYFRAMDQRLRHLDLTQSQADLLYALWEDPSLGQRDLSSILGISAPSLSGLIDALVKKSFLERQPDPRDQRRVVLKLSARAQNVRQETLETRARVADLLKTGLSDGEVDVLDDLLERLLHNLRQTTSH